MEATAEIRSPTVRVKRRSDGSFLLSAPQPLPPYPNRLTERLEQWAARAPDRPFLAERAGDGWRKITYAEALSAVRSLAEALLRRDLSAERPVLILSGNDIDHALLGLACMHIGIPYAPISPAYSLLSSDLLKLRQIIALSTPGLVFVADGAAFRRALEIAVPADVEVVVVQHCCQTDTPFEELRGESPTSAVDEAAAAVRPNTIAKLLFTSGSTGAPKAVINTHRMLCSNQAMIADHFPFLVNEPPVIVDWLLWSHTFGGNNNFNLVLYNGGTLYIDSGRPLPGQFQPTIQALWEVAPTLHLAVPKSWEELAQQLRADSALNLRFFSRMRVLFYAAASLPQPLWDELESLSFEATGQVIPMITGLGATETAPMAFCSGIGNSFAGNIGLPVAGVEVKLAPLLGKLEARVRGPNIMPGYWRDSERTALCYDEEGYYCMGDALAWVDPQDYNRGLRFDGRLAEDFKLLSGTWVSVGPLRNVLLAAMSPLIRDVVITGHDKDYIAVLALPAIAETPAMRATLQQTLTALMRKATGSATRVMRMAFVQKPPAIDKGEITDKGTLNQAAMLRGRPSEVAALYAEPPQPHVICAETVEPELAV